MNVDTILSKITTIFREKLEFLANNTELDTLTADVGEKIIDEIQKASSLIGLESLKMIFEGYDIKARRLLINGKVYRKKMDKEKKVLTPLGELKLKRSIFQKDVGGKAYIPLDDKLGIRGENMTKDVQGAILYSCAHNTPEETSKIIEKLCPYKLHASSIKRLVNKVVSGMESNLGELIGHVHQEETVPDGADVFVASLDGANILLDEPGSKKGRPKERPGNKTEDKNKTCYKNAMCGSFTYYHVNQDKSGGNKPERLQSRYIAHMPEDSYPSFKANFEKEIIHHLKDVHVPKILLCDGHKSIWGYINATELYHDFEKLIDFYHAMEHLSKLSEWIFGKASLQGQNWYDKMKGHLLNNNEGVGQLIKSSTYYLKTKKISKKQKEGATKELNYFKRNKSLMEYKRFIDNGWPIGSGVIEAACKSIVKQRMCRSGQRWSREKGQYILTLRTLVKSSRWEDTWKNYNFIKNAA